MKDNGYDDIVRKHMKEWEVEFHFYCRSAAGILMDEKRNEGSGGSRGGRKKRKKEELAEQ